jgi:hypothetical protein
MKRLLFLSMCILLIGAPMVNAEIINVSAARTVFDGTWDQVILKIASFEGSQVPTSGYGLSTMLGTWTSDVGINLPGNSTTWYKNVTNHDDAQDRVGPQTWVNFSTKSPETATRTGTSPNYTAFYEGFSTTLDNTNAYALGPVDYTPGPASDTSLPGEGFDNTLLAVFYVKHADTTYLPGKTVWTGVAAYGKVGGGGDGILGVPTSIQIAIPEPSTLALLGCGLFGLLAYAWRKRK